MRVPSATVAAAMPGRVLELLNTALVEELTLLSATATFARIR